MSRLGQIANRLRRASGSDFWVEEIDHIEGERLQAAAFAAGNRVKVTRELANTLTDDELAYVISHEIAHLEEGHTARLEDTRDAAVSVARASLRTVDNALKRSGVGLAGRMVGALASTAIAATAAGLTTLKHSRDLEREADNRGQELSRAAGYDPGGAASAIAKITDGETQDPGFLGRVTSTHPSPGERFSNLTRRARK